MPHFKIMRINDETYYPHFGDRNIEIILTNRGYVSHYICPRDRGTSFPENKARHLLSRFQALNRHMGWNEQYALVPHPLPL